MECPRRWATIYLLIYLSLNVANVFCQKIHCERMQPEVSTQPQIGNLKREVAQTPSPSKAQLINALLSYASAKGLMPKTSKIIQEQPQISTIQHTPNRFNVPIQNQISSNCENRPKLSITSNPTVSLNPIYNQVSPPTTSYSPSMILQPTLKTEPVSWTFSPNTCQVGYVENSAGVQPCNTVWHIPQPSMPVSEISSCTTNQPMVCNEATHPYPNLPMRVLPTKNTDPCNTNFRTISEEPLIVTSDDTPALPINLQINIPSPNDLGPRLTVVTAAPPIHEPVTTFSSYAFPPPPPIIMKRSRSCLRKLLPIILLALINDSGGCGCPCNCDSDDHIPIPYPIPMPINNPTISSGCNSPYSSRNRE